MEEFGLPASTHGWGGVWFPLPITTASTRNGDGMGLEVEFSSKEMAAAVCWQIQRWRRWRRNEKDSAPKFDDDTSAQTEIQSRRRRRRRSWPFSRWKNVVFSPDWFSTRRNQTVDRKWRETELLADWFSPLTFFPPSSYSLAILRRKKNRITNPPWMTMIEREKNWQQIDENKNQSRTRDSGYTKTNRIVPIETNFKKNVNNRNEK